MFGVVFLYSLFYYCYVPSGFTKQRNLRFNFHNSQLTTHNSQLYTLHSIPYALSLKPYSPVVNALHHNA